MGCNHGKVSAPKPSSGTAKAENTLLASAQGQKDKDAAEFPEQPAVSLLGIFDGVWSNGVINGDKLTWSDDTSTVSQLKIDEAIRSIQFTTHTGVLFTGELQTDDKIHWSDGDVWERCDAVTTSKAPAPVAADATASAHKPTEPQAKQEPSPPAPEQVKHDPVPKPPLAVSHSQHYVPPAPDGSKGTLVPITVSTSQVTPPAPDGSRGYPVPTAAGASGSQQPRAQSTPAKCAERGNPTAATLVTSGVPRAASPSQAALFPGGKNAQNGTAPPEPRKEKTMCCC